MLRQEISTENTDIEMTGEELFQLEYSSGRGRQDDKITTLRLQC